MKSIYNIVEESKDSDSVFALFQAIQFFKKSGGGEWLLPALNEERDEVTPLALALNKGRLDMAVSLVTAGANLSGYNLFYKGSCLSTKPMETARFLLDFEYGFSVKDPKTQKTTLHALVEHDTTLRSCVSFYSDKRSKLYELADIIIDRQRLNFNAQDINGRTPLHRLQKSESELEVHVAKKLLAGGADVNIVDKDGRTALHDAANFGHKKLLEIFLASGRTEVNIVDKHGRAALHYAVIFDSSELTKIFLQNRSVDVNIVDKKGQTPLLRAVLAGYSGIVARLILDSRTNKRNIEDKLLIDLVAKQLDPCKNSGDAKQLLDFFLDKGFDFADSAYDGSTILHSLLNGSYSSNYLIEPLFSRCPKYLINNQDADGNTVLHKLMYKRNNFIGGWAAVSSDDEEEENPEESHITGVTSILSKWKDYIDFSLQNKEGETLLDLARTFDIKEIIARAITDKKPPEWQAPKEKWTLARRAWCSAVARSVPSFPMAGAGAAVGSIADHALEKGSSIAC
jgi:ankyrin repeat protein